MKIEYGESGRGKPPYLKPSICSKCGGICCTNMPGVCLPSDFKEPLLRSLAEAFRSGKYAIDWWEGDPRKNGGGLRKTYFVRPATRNSRGLFDSSWGGECVLLTPSGCSLAPRERPSGCRLLEPKTNGECYSHLGGMTDNDKRIAAVRWMKYQNIILGAVKAANR